MFRSLYSGVSGLTANLTEIDVISNNIANSNTIGFKAGRVTFAEMLTQNIRSASRPISGGQGGTNPIQIGLGTIVGSVDTNFNQGNFQTTGIKTDLAIQGDGFFIMSDGLSSYYTRAGAFGLDSNNFLVNPATGHHVQGVMANADGEILPGTLDDLFIDTSLVMEAQATENVELFGNLDSDSDAMETVLQSDTFLAVADGNDLLTNMYGQGANSFGLHDGDLISVSVMIGSGTPWSPPGPFLVGGVAGSGGDTYNDLVNWLDQSFFDAGYGNIDFSINTNTGALQVDNGGGDVLTNLALNVGGRVHFNQNFAFPSEIAAGATTDTAQNGPDRGEMRAPASADDLFSRLYGVDGKHLGLDMASGSAVVEINGTQGGEAITSMSMVVDDTTTLNEFLTRLQGAFRIASGSVTVNDTGQIVVRGDVGTTNAIGDITIREVLGPGASNDVMESSFHFLETQEARDEQSFSVATTVFDSLGTGHTIHFVFQKESGLNEWIWRAEMEGDEAILLGSQGRARFTENGAVSSFTFDDGSSQLTFRPQPIGEEGADLVTLDIDFGTLGQLDGLTQFDASGSLQALADGYTTGSLVDFEIDQNGLIIGHYSNDTVQNLARIGLVQFSNPAGLSRAADNTYRRSGNSGTPLATFPGEGHGTSLVPGTLESSNVDLAEQFTRLVVAQRAFQANARVITAGDQILQEMVSILR
ncbi:MAG: flagellar hook-basal body complex protein [bacterium]